MRIHLLGIPHTATSNDKKWMPCAFTQKVYKLSQILAQMLGYIVYHYGHEDSEVDCSEHISVVTQEDWNYSYGNLDVEKDHYQFGIGDYAYQTFFKNTERELRKRVQKDDLVLCAFGTGHKPLIDRIGDLPVHVIESGIGYPSTFAPHRVFESYWKMAQDTGERNAKYNLMNSLKGRYPEVEGMLKHDSQPYTQPNWTDEVIYNYWDHNDFTYVATEDKEDYAAFVGRIVWTKGLDIAMRTCAHLGIPLKIAGQGWDNFEKEYKFKPYGDYEYLGTVGLKERDILMSKAKMLFVPTRYPEPFGGVHAEAMFCGTPPITSDRGVFAEVIEDEYNGFRCNEFNDYVYAAKNIHLVSSENCRDWAMQNYTLERAALKYDRYFKKILRVAESGGNYWMLNNDKDELHHHKQHYPTDMIDKKLEALASERTDGNRYNPGGSVKGGDPWLTEPLVLDYVIDTFEVRSVLDVGAGEGHTSKYFADKGLTVTAIDGDQHAILAGTNVVHHDLRTSQYTASPTDMLYCVEVLEHIAKKYLPNVADTIKSANPKYLLITAARPGDVGVGHINLQEEHYWVNWFESIGYQVDGNTTKHLRETAEQPTFSKSLLFLIKA